MNNSTIAWKTRAQLDDFMVKMFHGFSKPKNKFIRDMIYGIQATGDTILTDISRAIDSGQKHRNVENRLSRNLQTEGLSAEIQTTVMNDARRFIDKNTLIIIDPPMGTKVKRGQSQSDFAVRCSAVLSRQFIV